MLKVASAANPKFKSALRLQDRRGRQRQNRFLIDGLREIRYAVNCGIRLEAVFATDPELLRQESSIEEEVLQIELADELFQKLTYGQRDSKMVAIAEPPQRSLETLQLSTTPFVVIVEGLEKPGNLGAIARTADAVGVDALILADCKIDPFNPNAIRASMGTVLAETVVESDSETTLNWLRQNGIEIHAAWVEAEHWYHESNYRRATAIVLGSEADGLTQRWNDTQIHQVRLPMLGVADSLNVSTTAAVMLYEVWRQRFPKTGSEP